MQEKDDTAKEEKPKETKPEQKSPANKSEEGEKLDQKDIDEALKQKYEVKADKRIHELFMDKEHLAPQMIGASEIDLFAMETRARKTLAGLVAEINEQISGEQQKRAEIQLYNQGLCKRILKLEEFIGAVNNKPKEIIELENKMSTMRSESSYHQTQVDGTLAVFEQARQKQCDRMHDVEVALKNMEEKLSMREKQIIQCQEESMKQKNDLINASDQIYKKMDSMKSDFTKQISDFQMIINTNCQDIRNFGTSLQQFEDQLQNLRKTNSNMIKDIEHIHINKVDETKFLDIQKNLENKFETNQLGIKDNFSQLMATDNYLEKYLPFKVQMMISDSLENLIDPIWSQLQEVKLMKAAENLGQEKSLSPSNEREKNATKMTNTTGLTQIQKEPSPHPGRDLTLLELYKAFEFKVFKRMHKIVMADQGIPTLKKRGFMMPGSRKILETSERDKLNSRSQIQQSLINSPINSPADLQHQSSMSGQTKSLDKSKLLPTQSMAANSRQNASPQPQRSTGRNDSYRSNTLQNKIQGKEVAQKVKEQDPKISEVNVMETTPAVEDEASSQAKMQDGLSNNSTILKNNSLENDPQAQSGMHVLQRLTQEETHVPRIQPPKVEKNPDDFDDDQTEVAKSIGFEDLEGPLNAMIQKGYQNSFLIMENFENMKTDFRIQREELLGVLDKKILSHKNEIRDILEKQLQFIEEQGYKHQKQMEENNEMIQQQDLKIELMSQRQQQNIIDHYNNYQNTRQSYGSAQSDIKKSAVQRRLKSAAKTGNHSRNNTTTTLQPKVDIEGLLSFRKYEKEGLKQDGGTQFMNLRSSSDSLKGMGNSISVTDVVGQQKYWQDWITEALKLQNILNNQTNSQMAQNKSILINLHNQIYNTQIPQPLIDQNLGLVNQSTSMADSTAAGGGNILTKIYDSAEQQFQQQQPSEQTNLKGMSQKNEDLEIRQSQVNLSITVDDQQSKTAGPLANSSQKQEQPKSDPQTALANQQQIEPKIVDKNFESPSAQAVISDILNQPTGIPLNTQDPLPPNYNEISHTQLSPSTLQDVKNDNVQSQSTNTARQQPQNQNSQNFFNFYPSLIDCTQVIGLIDRIIENCESINRQRINPFETRDFLPKGKVQDQEFPQGQNSDLTKVNQASIFSNKRLNDSQKNMVEGRSGNQSTKISSSNAQFGLGKYLHQQKNYQSPIINRVSDSPDGVTRTINLQGASDGYTPPLQMLNTIGGSNFAGTYPTGIGLPTAFPGETLRSNTTIGGESIRQMRIQPNSTLQNPVSWGILQSNTINPSTLQQSGHGYTQNLNHGTRGIYTHIHQQIRPQSSKIQLGRRIVKTSMTKPLPMQSGITSKKQIY